MKMVFNHKQIEKIDMGKGVIRQDFAEGKNMNVLHWNMSDGSEVGMHTHPQEQFGYVIKGGFHLTLKSATKLFSVLLASKRPLITELADKLRLKYPLLPTISPCPTMRLEAIRSIIPISCRRYPKSV